ncbi:MAG: rod shape-determining protein MreD [Lachnospiraceae bacterium]|jgi:rod shape-determining protein MreD|nr:rod shape-determining protein MreD [Lachnospiraceae bacterium]MCI7094329.1 rod shape-determining protein MreD [Lachnospiraceae bacterium]
MKRRIALTLLCIVTALLQTAWPEALCVASIGPNLAVILTASFALMCGSRTGMLMGFWTGMLIDLFSGGRVGYYALIYAWTGFLAGFAYRIFYDDDIKTPMLLIGLSDLLCGLYQYIGSFLLRGRIHFFFYLGRIIIPELIYTVILGVFVYQLNYLINKKTIRGYFSV